jgi:hypothetical protein
LLENNFWFATGRASAMPNARRKFLIAVLNSQQGEKRLIIQIVMDLEFFLLRCFRFRYPANYGGISACSVNCVDAGRNFRLRPA